MQNVRVGYQLVFGKEQLDAQTHNYVHLSQEQLTHVLHLPQLMDLAMEQEQLHPLLLVLQIIHFAQLPHQPTTQMLNAKLGDQPV